MLDRFDREINYLRISVTDRCNLRCIYCMPEGGIPLKTHSDILSYEKMVSVAEAAVRLGLRKVRLTGGEPLVRKGFVSFVRELKKIEGLEHLTLTTNGILLKQMAGDLKDARLDRLNISLDTLKPERYRRITRIGNIEDALAGIMAAKETGFRNTKINMVLIPGTNDDEIEDMKAFCDTHEFKLQRINHYTLKNLGSISKKYVAERPLPCHLCNRIRLTADGQLKSCLFSDVEIPLDESSIEESLKRAILSKPREGTACTLRGNWQIGG